MLRNSLNVKPPSHRCRSGHLDPRKIWVYRKKHTAERLTHYLNNKGCVKIKPLSLLAYKVYNRIEAHRINYREIMKACKTCSYHTWVTWLAKLWTDLWDNGRCCCKIQETKLNSTSSIFVLNKKVIIKDKDTIYL